MNPNEDIDQTLSINEIHGCIAQIAASFKVKAKQARETASKARKSKNSKKAEKFNAIARVYEMNAGIIELINCKLWDHTSEEYQEKSIPF